MLLTLRARFHALAQRTRAAFSDAEHVKAVSFSPEKPDWLSEALWRTASSQVRAEIARGDYTITYADGPRRGAPENAHGADWKPPKFEAVPADPMAHLEPWSSSTGVLPVTEMSDEARAEVKAKREQARLALAGVGTWGPDGLVLTSSQPQRKRRWWRFGR